MMQTDVKSSQLTSSNTVFAGPARIKGVYINPGASTGSVVFKDGGANGTTVLTLNTPALGANGSSTVYILLPGEGIWCASNVHATLSQVAAVTTFYG